MGGLQYKWRTYTGQKLIEWKRNNVVDGMYVVKGESAHSSITFVDDEKKFRRTIVL